MKSYSYSADQLKAHERFLKAVGATSKANGPRTRRHKNLAHRRRQEVG